MKTVPIAKIARPRLSGVVKRERLFHLLDQAQRKPVVWVASQGGSGKTTLVADWLNARGLPCLWYQIDEGDGDIATFFYYMGMAAKSAAPRYKKPLPLLTPEYLQGIPVFTRRYFEELFRRLNSPTLAKGGEGGFVLVLDNYQDVPLASGFHDMIAHGLDTIPEGVTVVILSRVASPPQFARLQANNRLHLIGWDDVRFNREESHDLLEKQGQSKLSPETMELLQNKTEGWAAGLILLAGAGTTASASPSLATMKAGVLFDYFASEIFGKTDASTQEVLLKTSFLQKIDPAMAERLTGNAMAEQILERMSRDHYFTQNYGSAYQYHPLFREFLQSRARTTFSFGDIVAVQRRAAELMEQSGNGDEAVGLYIAAADWISAERVILNLAQTLVSQGRSNTLEGWLSSLPQEHIEDSPWVFYWFGICRLTYNPAEARAYFEKAFPLFKKIDDVSGLFLSWACIVDTFFYEWGDFKPLDHWITVAENFIDEYPEFPSPEIGARFTAGMLNALSWRQPHRADLPVWAERVWQIVLQYPGAQLRIMLGNILINYYLWMGDSARADLLMDVLRPVNDLERNDAPLTRQHWHVMEAMHSWVVADGSACIEAVTNGLKNAEESGIHLLDLFLLGQGVYSGLSLGAPSVAETCLTKMSEINILRHLDKSFYHYQAASIAWYHGDSKKAIKQGWAALQLIKDAGAPAPHSMCLIELAVSLFDDGQHEEAKKILAEGGEVARGMNAMEFMHLMHGARFAFDLDDEERGLALLGQGLALGSRQGCINIPRWNNATMSRLCAKALAHDIEPGYVRKLIVKRGLTSEHPVKNWPYPIRIHTLGRFELLTNDKPVTFTGKAQKKPVELLKVLIASGGKDVPEEQIVDALWPDSEGDAGHSTFNTTISRLRQLLGNDKAIQVSARAVTLDPRYCYVDAWAFEALVQEAESKLRSKQKGIGSDSGIALKISDIYRGHFLPAETASNWTVSFRERLRDKFLRHILKAGMSLEEQGCCSEAVELYRRTLEADDLSEEVCQRLMSCHLQLGQQSEAVSAYKRLRQTLLKVHGITPSGRTEALYQAALMCG